MMADPFGRHYGYSLSRAAHVASGVMYPILDRMLEDGWVTDEWETAEAGRNARSRRYYTLTNAGRAELGGITAIAQADPRFVGLFRLDFL
jgi:PadR family transcriptional regulator PadR